MGFDLLDWCDDMPEDAKILAFSIDIILLILFIMVIMLLCMDDGALESDSDNAFRKGRVASLMAQEGIHVSTEWLTDDMVRCESSFLEGGHGRYAGGCHSHRCLRLACGRERQGLSPGARKVADEHQSGSEAGECKRRSGAR